MLFCPQYNKLMNCRGKDLILGRSKSKHNEEKRNPEKILKRGNEKTQVKHHQSYEEEEYYYEESLFGFWQHMIFDLLSDRVSKKPFRL